MIARIASYFIGMAIATSALAADVVADDAWVNFPEGAPNGTARLSDVCTGTSMQYCSSPKSQLTGGGNITVDTHGITVPPRSQLTGDISSTPRDPSRCVFEIDGSSTIIGVHPVPCHINIPAPQDIVIEARPDPLDALKLNNSQFVH